MQMEDGIGRGGYRVLAFVFFGVGALGLAMAAVALSPSGFFDWLGLGLAAVALASLTGVALSLLGPMPAGLRSAFSATPAGAGAPDSGVVPLPTPEPPVDADPSVDLGFEYPEVEPLAPRPEPVSIVPPPPPRTGRSLSTPPPMARPAHSTAPPSGKADPGAGGWPERRGKAGVTRRQVAERNAPPPPASSGPDIEMDGRPPAARREPPIVMARTVASAEATGIPEGTGVGKCGNCGVLLLAPKKRPIRLQCPRCERVHTLA
jgi:hypothetical protein